MNEVSSMETVWMVRDARGLNTNEKAFLFVVASRGVMTASYKTAAADMGFGKDTYYKTRDSLIKKDLIEVGRRNESTTVYRINVASLKALVPAKVSVSQNDFSVSQNELSATQNELSVEPEQKVTTKGTKKVTSKETNTPTVADAPVAVDKDELKDTKESLEPSLLNGSSALSPERNRALMKKKTAALKKVEEKAALANRAHAAREAREAAAVKPVPEGLENAW